MKRTVKRKRSPIITVLFFILLALGIFVFTQTDEQPSPSSTQQSSSPPSSKPILADNDYITATFDGFTEADTLGSLYTNLHFHNKTTQKLWLYLSDASVNNTTMQMVMTGSPVYVLPSQDAIGSYIFPLTQVGLSSCKEVSTVSFRITIANPDALSTIATSDTITVNK